MQAGNPGRRFTRRSPFFGCHWLPVDVGGWVNPSSMKHEARAVPHAPAYLSCVAGLVGWPGHLRTLARVMFPRMFPTLLTRSRKSLSYREAPVGIEPTNRGFADLCLTTWLRRQAVKSHQKRLVHQVRSARQHALIVR